MLVAIVVGYVALGLFKLCKQGKELSLDFKHGWWMLLYLAAIAITSYLGSFGGGLNVIPFGWDFLVIAIVTVVIYELSQAFSKKTVQQEPIIC